MNELFKYLIPLLLGTYPLFSLSMSLEEKIGQLFVAPVLPLEGETHFAKVDKLLKSRHIGAAIFMQGDLAIQKSWITRLQEGKKTGLLTLQDAEWGTGMQLRDVAPWPKNLTLGAIQDEELLKAFGRAVAQECKEALIQGNLAPVADVNSNPLNPVINIRSLGEEAKHVAQKAVSIMQGMQEGGILTCAKHFPGHGDTSIDSHRSLPIIEKTLEELTKIELLPFKALIEAGVDMVMIGHLLFPALDTEMATYSFAIIEGLLRRELGFKGVVITDSLLMGAVAQDTCFSERVLKAFHAGADLFLANSNKKEEVEYLLETGIPEAIEALMQECAEGKILETQINEKVERILALKEKASTQRFFEFPDLKKTLFRSAITHVGPTFLPLQSEERIALFQARSDPDLAFFLEKKAFIDVFSFEEIEKAKNYKRVLVHLRKKEEMKEVPEGAILILFDSPYALKKLPKEIPILVGYEDVAEAKEAVVDVLFGLFSPLGKLPIRL